MRTTVLKLVSTLMTVLVSLPGTASLNINTETVEKAVVFIYAARSDGEPETRKPLGTGFLVSIPSQDAKSFYLMLVTARHIVEPQWAFCAEANPSRIFVRLNRSHFDAEKDSNGVEYVPVDLMSGDKRRYFIHTNNEVDAAVVLLTPDTFKAPNYAVGSISIQDFGTSDETKTVGIGDAIVSAGLVPGYSGEKRNYPIFKFGYVSSIPNESVWLNCEPGKPALRLARVWFIAANLIPGNSGSPIFYVPAGGGGVMFGNAVSRAILLGVQSNSLLAADVAGMTPLQYVFEIVQSMKLPNANLTRGTAPASK